MSTRLTVPAIAERVLRPLVGNPAVLSVSLTRLVVKIAGLGWGLRLETAYDLPYPFLHNARRGAAADWPPPLAVVQNDVTEGVVPYPVMALMADLKQTLRALFTSHAEDARADLMRARDDYQAALSLLPALTSGAFPARAPSLPAEAQTVWEACLIPAILQRWQSPACWLDLPLAASFEPAGIAWLVEAGWVDHNRHLQEALSGVSLSQRGWDWLVSQSISLELLATPREAGS
jgi:hypothetical protein